MCASHAMSMHAVTQGWYASVVSVAVAAELILLLCIYVVDMCVCHAGFAMCALFVMYVCMNVCMACIHVHGMYIYV